MGSKPMTLIELSELMKAFEFATRLSISLVPYNTPFVHGFHLITDGSIVVATFLLSEPLSTVYDSVCSWFFEKELQFERSYGRDI